MTKVFEENTAAVELLLSIILERNDLEVKKAVSQYNLKNLQGRSIRLDVFAIDKDGKQYNIEIQRESKGAIAKRAQYNSSLLDSNSILAGEAYEKLPETYIIFITKADVLHAGRPLYHINRIVEETGEYFGDAAHIIYVRPISGRFRFGPTDGGFSSTQPEQMHYKVLADKVRYLKGTEDGVNGMSGIVEQLCKEAAEEAAKDARIDAREKVRAEERTRLVRSVVKMSKRTNGTFDDAVSIVAEETGLSDEAAADAVKRLWTNA